MRLRIRLSDFGRACVKVALLFGVVACSANASRADHSADLTGAGGGTSDGAPGAQVAVTEGGIVFNTGGATGMGVPCTDGTGWACKIDACNGQPKTTVRA